MSILFTTLFTMTSQCCPWSGCRETKLTLRNTTTNAFLSCWISYFSWYLWIKIELIFLSDAVIFIPINKRWLLYNRNFQKLTEISIRRIYIYIYIYYSTLTYFCMLFKRSHIMYSNNSCTLIKQLPCNAR